MHVLVAPNAFKNSLSAKDAARAIAAGIKKSLLDCSVCCFPIADGGDGTGPLITERLKGFEVCCRVHDALGREVEAAFGLIDRGKTAVIEMAAASGLRLLDPGELSPLQANSFGTGELIREALGYGVTKIIIAMGGSATIDGGAGMLRAVGVRFLDSRGKDLQILPRDLVHLQRIDTTEMDERLHSCQVVVLCDVENLLLGKEGAANTFGPQKGAGEQEIIQLEEGLQRFSDAVMECTGKDLLMVKRGGVAGGAAAGLYALLNAELVSGIDYFLDITGFEEYLSRADLIITGEGSLDSQTLRGKAPLGVALRAKKGGVVVVGLAGKINFGDQEAPGRYFDVLFSIGNGEGNLEDALRHTESNLQRTAYQIGNLLGFSNYHYR